MATLLASDISLNYLQVSEGDQIVLIHGLGANLAFWYMGAGRILSRDYSVLMYDLRGHGMSAMPQNGYSLHEMTEDLRQLIDHQGIDRAHIVGHSYGARVALCFAGRYPERTRTLTVADTQVRSLQPPMRLSDWPHWMQWKAELAQGGLAELPSDDAWVDFRLLARLGEYDVANRGGRPAHKPISVRRRDMGNKGQARWQRLIETTSAKYELQREEPLAPEYLRTIAAPTLLLFGAYSHCLPTANALQRLIPNSRMRIVPGAGHFFPVIKPRYFASEVGQFLSGSPARTGPLRTIRQRRQAAGAQTLWS
jgi:pimeloyl-ACP methyl ester carboxylesterase